MTCNFIISGTHAPRSYLVAKLEQIRGDTFRSRLGGLLQPVELEPELVKPCFLAPPAPSKQLGKELQLSGALPLEPVVSAPIWQGSCRSRRWSRSRSPAKDRNNLTRHIKRKGSRPCLYPHALCAGAAGRSCVRSLVELWAVYGPCVV